MEKQCCCASGSCANTKLNSLQKPLLYFGILLYLFTLGIDFKIIPLEFKFLEILYIFCYFILGFGILKEALLGLIRREFFNENSLMALASLGAWIIGDGAEAVAILFFYRIGEALEDKIVEKSKASIKSLASLKIENAKILQNGEISTKKPQDIKEDDIIVLYAGDRIPADGIIIKGESSIDNSALNGESLPQSVKVGDSLLSGGINLDGTLQLKATKSYEDSAFSKIIKLIEEGSSKKSKSEEFITKFARYYTPCVTLLALSIIIFPTLYSGLIHPSSFMLGIKESFNTWLYRGIIFLVVSCPCALVVSIPLTFFASLGRASKEGILIKGSSYLESLFYANAIIFDKTGTLTKGELIIEDIITNEGFKSEFVLGVAKLLEQNSNHPIAKAINSSNLPYTKFNQELSSIKEIAGNGISAMLEDKQIALGNARFISKICNIDLQEDNHKKAQIFISYNNKLCGFILLSDAIKQEAKDSIFQIKKEGISELFILSGDKQSVVEEVAKQIGIKEYFANLLPKDKVEKLESILQKERKKGKKVVFVGDGINDAPSLALSDIGIAMGKGSDVALEGADIVILNDDLNKIPKALSIAQKTRKILWQNIIFALGVKVGIMVLGAFGMANLWVALFGDVGVALLALLNAVRAIR
ncbi:heavy metal translocating P-type ATPase [Helicobacter burdigaliensis]|uniref:heavy metal translocating P-type ATPase n=1 Tax=Helicobacter burdigaliensis TaxID=2315334 RepID=UPI000EF64B03|nr:heavy metal translocating P-type ATPase [Helicobacter burdigaliensis]